MMIECCEQPHRHHSAIFEKYAERRFKEASTIVQEALDAGFTLPLQPHPVRAEYQSPSERDYGVQFDQYSEEPYSDLSRVDDGAYSSKPLSIHA